MKKLLLFSLLLFLLLPVMGWGALTDIHHVTFTGRGLRDGSSFENAFSFGQIYESTVWDTDEDDDNKIGQGDTVYFHDDDGDFIGHFLIRTAGSSGKPIIFTNYPGKMPVFAGDINTSGMTLGTPSEMITNPGFEDGMTGWTTEVGGSSTIAQSDEQANSGTYSAKIVRNGTTSRLRRTFNVNPNTWYALSYYNIRIAGVSSGNLMISDKGTMTGTTMYLTDMMTTWTTTSNTIDGISADSASWTRKGLLFRTGAGQTQIEIILSFFGDCTIHVDDFSLKKIGWELVSGTEYRLTPMFHTRTDGAANNNLSPPYYSAKSNITYWGDTELLPGTTGSLNEGECGWDSINQEEHINIGKNPEGEVIHIPRVTYLIGSFGAYHYITINGLTFRYTSVASAYGTIGGAILASNTAANYWTITNNVFFGIQNVGVNNSVGNDWLIEYNTGNRFWNGQHHSDLGGGGYGYPITLLGTGSIVRKNYFRNQYCGIVASAGGNKIHYNILDGIKVNGLWHNCLSVANPNEWYNNTVYHNPEEGGPGHGFAAQDNDDGPGDIGGAKVKNNLIITVQENGGAQAFCIKNSTNIESNNNLFFTVGTNAKIARLEYAGTLENTDIATMAEYQATIAALKDNPTLKWNGTYGSVGTAADANSIGADPRFRSTTDYRLRSGSPAINAGVDVGLTTDFLGKPIRGLPDIGAYEFQSVGGGLGMGIIYGF